MKQIVIRARDEAIAKIEELNLSAEKALLQLANICNEQPLSALHKMKFEQIGCDPLDSERPLNLIEQINQTFTYLASFKAVDLLFQLHGEINSFILNLGTFSGSDILSTPQGLLAAEVFAAVNPKNNRKLQKDIEKVGSVAAENKYVFFMSPKFDKGRQQQLESHPDIQVWSVGGL